MADDGETPRRRLYAICRAYLHFARTRPRLYRTMFGVWRTLSPEDGSVVNGELTLTGAESLHLLAETIHDCVAEGSSTSTDPAGDAVALWLGLHGLADQRAVMCVPLGPPDLAYRIISVLAHLTAEQDRPAARRSGSAGR